VPFTRKQWSFAANVLRFVGAGVGLTAFISLLLLSGYYVVKRPHIPQPEFGYTVRLNVDPPTYGTSDDQGRLVQLLSCLFSGIVLIAAGECIFIYKLNIDRSAVGRIHF
jgi:hypothetical protein